GARRPPWSAAAAARGPSRWWGRPPPIASLPRCRRSIPAPGASSGGCSPPTVMSSAGASRSASRGDPAPDGADAMAKLTAGRATAEATRRYTERFEGRLAEGNFRALGRGPMHSPLGLGTDRGPEDGATDVLYQDAALRALELGVNVIDTAVNYRHQRSERAIRTALATAIGRGVLGRDEVVVATKGGFIPFDGAVPRDPRGYFSSTYLETGIIKPGDVVQGAHCMTPRYLRDQIDRSRANLAVETLDIYYLHTHETQLAEVYRVEFDRRVRAAFEALEAAVADAGIARYGAATWTGFRADPTAADYLSLAELVAIAREVGGQDHHF